MQKVLLLLTTVLIACSLSFAQDNKDDKKSTQPAKLTAEEIVAKHLASIGTPADIAAVKSRVLVGQGRLNMKSGGIGALSGPAQFASAGNMVLMAMIFNANNYPYEKMAFNGKDLTVGFPNGQKTDLANFLRSRNPIVKEGLFGGVLSAAWPLLDVKGKKVKLDAAGITKFGDKNYYKLKYTSGVGDLSVSLYFDSENFHHVLTEYKYSIQSTMTGISTDSSAQKPQYNTLTEQFGDFKTAGKLTLPFSYKINVTNTEEDSTVISTDWSMNFANVYYDEPLDAAVFKVS